MLLIFLTLNKNYMTENHIKGQHITGNCIIKITKDLVEK